MEQKIFITKQFYESELWLGLGSRQFSKVEAAIHYLGHNDLSERALSKIWGWTRHSVRSFLSDHDFNQFTTTISTKKQTKPDQVKLVKSKRLHKKVDQESDQVIDQQINQLKPVKRPIEKRVPSIDTGIGDYDPNIDKYRWGMDDRELSNLWLKDSEIKILLGLECMDAWQDLIYEIEAWLKTNAFLGGKFWRMSHFSLIHKWRAQKINNNKAYYKCSARGWGWWIKK